MGMQTGDDKAQEYVAMYVKDGEILKWAQGTYEQIKSVWLLDTGADLHVMTLEEWQ